MNSQPLTKADELFNLQLKTSIAEFELTEMFEQFSDPFTWEDFGYDHYDCSLEIYGVPENYQFEREDLNLLANYGFRQVWTHVCNKDNRTLGHEKGEQYYNLRS